MVATVANPAAISCWPWRANARAIDAPWITRLVKRTAKFSLNLPASRDLTERKCIASPRIDVTGSPNRSACS